MKGFFKEHGKVAVASIILMILTVIAVYFSMGFAQTKRNTDGQYQFVSNVISTFEKTNISIVRTDNGEEVNGEVLCKYMDPSILQKMIEIAFRETYKNNKDNSSIFQRYDYSEASSTYIKACQGKIDFPKWSEEFFTIYNNCLDKNMVPPMDLIVIEPHEQYHVKTIAN